MAASILTVLILVQQILGFYCFDYRTVNQWKNEFPSCGGRRQSPINLDLRFNRTYLPKLLELKGYDVRPTQMTLTNDGHSAKIVAKWPTGQVPSVSGGPLTDNIPYLFDSLHFHWSQSDNRGSEHTINGKRFALEMHLVHYKSTYGSVRNATRYADGIAVVGVIYWVSIFGGPDLAPVTRNLPLVRQENRTMNITPFQLSHFQLQKERFFITYDGSLTTPPCSEAVTWLLARNIHTISKTQIASFRRLLFSTGDKENFRPVQPLNGRSIHYVRLRK